MPSKIDSTAYSAAIDRWRATTLAVVLLELDSTPEQRRTAWRFLKQHGTGSHPAPSTPSSHH